MIVSWEITFAGGYLCVGKSYSQFTIFFLIFSIMGNNHVGWLLCDGGYSQDVAPGKVTNRYFH